MGRREQVQRSLRRLGRALTTPVRGLHRAREGLAVLELALIMPLIVVLIMFVADMGLLFYGYVSASNAIREGARCGVVGYDDAAVIARVQDAAGITVPTAVSVSDRSAAGIGDAFTVTASFEHTYLTPLIPSLDLTQYTRSSTMQLETDTFDRTGCAG
ncbi:MAG: Flp pilus assembly protein TadG [Chloroflexi bacterium]|jgi:hypothetical protein|nr:MAG: Flp pilus assembly protein TadG [Chloroflexota bacterium]